MVRRRHATLGVRPEIGEDGQHLWAKGRSPKPCLGPELPAPPIEAFPPELQRVMRVVDLITTHDQRPADLAGEVDRVAASPGVHTGPVRIVSGPEGFGRVGDVLVEPITASP